MASTATDVITGVSTSAAVKPACKYVLSSNAALSGLTAQGGAGPFAADDRVLVPNQTTGAENGIYLASSSEWQRAADFDGSRDVRQGTVVLLAGGGSYTVTTADPIVIGTSAITFVVSNDLDLDAALANPAEGFGAALIGYTPPGGTATDVDTQLDRIGIYAASFGLLMDGLTSSATANTTALNAAIAYANGLTTGATIYIGDGLAYFDGPNIARSNVVLQGRGKYTTTFSMLQSNITTMDYSLFESVGNIDGFEMYDIGLRGNSSFQTTAGVNGSKDCCGISFQEGSVTNCTFERLYIRAFGDQAGSAGGGMILVPDADADNTSIRNVRVQNCHFGKNTNVAGAHIWSYIPTVSTGTSHSVWVTDNVFEGGGDQNCVYLAGQSDTLMKNCHVDRNSFYIDDNVDICVELNGCEAFTVNGNNIYVSGSGNAVGILIRGDQAAGADTEGGEIGNNILINSAASDNDGISIVAFDSGDFQDQINVHDNQVLGSWSVTTAASAFKILKGSRRVNLIDNIVDGLGSTRVYRAFDIGECSDITVKGGTVRNADNVIRLSEGTNPATANIDIDGINLVACGASGGAMIATTGGAIPLTGLAIRNNKARDSVGGVTYFASINTAANTGNEFVNNRVDVPPLDTTEYASFEYIELAGRPIISFASLDATPAVNLAKSYQTANAGATTITDFDNGFEGQEIFVKLDANTIVDFTGTNLKGNAGVDLTGTATNAIRCKKIGSTWFCDVVGA